MESLGEKLRTTREEKGLTVEQVSRDTNIIARYIEALEAEDFSIFPAETYITGFIRNYSSYLDIDAQKAVSLYRANRIQEQPTPVEQLLRPQINWRRIIITSLVILLVVGAGCFAAMYFFFNEPGETVISAPAVREPVEYTMEGYSIERRFYKNDSILVQANNDIYRLELFNLGEAVTIRTPGGTPVILDLSQPASIDLNNNGTPDLSIRVADFEKNNADMGALLHISLINTTIVQDTADYETQEIPLIVNAVSEANTTIIPASASAYPFTLQVNFQGYCMFRWEVLFEPSRAGRNQNYFQRMEELNIQAQNGIRIWSSNAQAARFQVIGGGRTYSVEIGGAGEVVVTDIRWVRDENSQYRLMVIRQET